jgi:tetratricopeptide (TPR) repeat protein
MRGSIAAVTVRLVPMLTLIALASAHADGPGGYRPREQQAPATSEQRAIDAYNAGYALIQRADSAAGNTTEARAAYEDALKKFDEAVRLDASMHEAYTYIGYANRKLGRYERALQAYSEALRINADYPYAIEYQGEAFLGLNRVDEARFNYLRLYALSTPQAAKLLRAMQAWVETNRQHPPAGVDFAGFEAWVLQRTATTPPPDTSTAAQSW